MNESPSPNRLVDETSPYLLQHAHNPVDWYPWGPEALERARREDLPILLSVGYAACHWCHVMERESFENPDIADVMNASYVCIKVDREERPDLDDIYMRAVQMMTGHGGWPLTVFLTPELEPFYGGTYFPPEDRGGMPSFRRLLDAVAHSFRERRGEVNEMAAQLREHLQPALPRDRSGELLGNDLVHRGALELHDRVDPNYGGFGSAPKFPSATSLMLMMRHAHRHHDSDVLAAALLSLRQMARGGIRDHVGGGFHRYATDARWLIPHFEKMLYDNALLAISCLDAYRLTGDQEMGAVAADTLDWVLREMQLPEGGYASTLDADSEGVEGKYYVWSRDEVRALLGPDADLFCAAYDVTPAGNWEGQNILNQPRDLRQVASDLETEPEALQTILRRGLLALRQARESRVRPGLDDKVLTDWNGLMIAAMARAGRSLGEPRYLDSAQRAATFVTTSLQREGRLLHTYRAGEARLLAYLDDHANLLWGLLELFRSTFDPAWLEHATRTADAMLELFWDPEDASLFFTGADHEQLITRLKSAHDSATPPGNAVAMRGLQVLAHLTGERAYAQRARDIAYAFAAQLRRAPSAFPTLLLGLDEHLADPREVVVVGSAEATREALAELWRQYAPGRLVLAVDPASGDRARLEGLLPALRGKVEANLGDPTFFVCRDYACEAPTRDLSTVLGSA